MGKTSVNISSCHYPTGRWPLPWQTNIEKK